ncbi:P-granule-associated novel protein 1-like [Coccinella septempunctata]|uniref:P-granule-associated novel protein 1-like n=1 Tax=Coccinella septempunctata TaxID=41139 RepID=UPI001D06C950|nr:P-granule-associated novel protein 1-like [Coccinella septempunctata]
MHVLLSRSSLFVLPLLALVALGHEDTRRDPIDILKVKNLLIKDYTGPLTHETLDLFHNIESLDLRNCNFTPFHESFLHPLPNLKRLAISNNVMERVDHDTSGCCGHLEDLELTNSGVGDLEEVELKKIGAMRSLKRLVFHNEKIPILHEDTLTDTNLVDVTIKHCNLASIEDGAFKKLQKLENLNLKKNQLKEIKKEVLAPLTNVKVINLSGNFLEKLTTDMIPSLPNLELLIVAHNPIKEFNLEGIKEVAPKLKTVDISGIEVDTSKSGGINLVKHAVL